MLLSYRKFATQTFKTHKMVELGLNSHHQAVLLSYMKFAQYLRGQAIKTVESDFQNSIDSLFDDTYTQDEVKKVLSDLQTLLTCDVQAEMSSFTHNNVLMLQQLFTQAETWHLRMEVQLSELQNRELLEMIRQLEDDETVLKPPTENNNEENSIALLRMELERLQIENMRLQDQQQECADKLEQTQEELTTVTEKLKLASSQIQAYREMPKPVSSDPEDSNKIADLANQLKEVEDVLHMGQETSRLRQDKLMTELNSTREQVLRVQSQLKLAELELERKFSQTNAYASMKQILVNKNNKIKLLREKLQEFVPEDNGDCEDEDDN